MPPTHNCYSDFHLFFKLSSEFALKKAWNLHETSLHSEVPYRKGDLHGTILPVVCDKLTKGLQHEIKPTTRLGGVS